MTETELLRIRRRVMHHVTRRLHGPAYEKKQYDFLTLEDAWDGAIKGITFESFEKVIKDELKRIGRVRVTN